MKNLATTLTWAAVLAVGLAPGARAVTISTVDGDVEVTPGTVALGTALTYASGGNGLTGIAAANRSNWRFQPLNAQDDPHACYSLLTAPRISPRFTCFPFLLWHDAHKTFIRQ